MDFGVLVIADARRTGQTARLVEELGFGTVLFPDSQNLARASQLTDQGLPVTPGAEQPAGSMIPTPMTRRSAG